MRCTQVAQDLEPVLSGKHDVEQQQVGRRGERPVDRLVAPGAHPHRVAGEGQDVAQPSPDRRVVLND